MKKMHSTIKEISEILFILPSFLMSFSFPLPFRAQKSFHHPLSKKQITSSFFSSDIRRGPLLPGDPGSGIRIPRDGSGHSHGTTSRVFRRRPTLHFFLGKSFTLFTFGGFLSSLFTSFPGFSIMQIYSKPPDWEEYQKIFVDKKFLIGLNLFILCVSNLSKPRTCFTPPKDQRPSGPCR
jgi:hypothetical protein